MPKYTLNYFNARGRAELPRLIFVAADLPYTDRRIEFPDWPSLKPTTPLGQVPYLEIDDVVIPQSLTIGRYLARETNLAGRNSIEVAQAEAIVDTITDGINAYVKNVMQVADPKEKEEAQKKFSAEEMPKHYGNVEKLIGLYGKNGYSVGDSLTWADLGVFDYAGNIVAVNPQVLDKFPNIKAVYKMVESHPKISAYLKSRPQTPW